MSPADGIRPAETRVPSITRPGVLMTPRRAISRMSVTWVISASTPAMVAASLALAARRWQLGQPEPSTSMVRMLLPLGWIGFGVARRQRPRSANQEVEHVSNGDDSGGYDSDEDGQQLGLHDPSQDYELGEADGGDGHHESQGRAQRHALPEESLDAVSYTHLRAHETRHDLVCR